MDNIKHKECRLLIKQTRGFVVYNFENKNIEI